MDLRQHINVLDVDEDYQGLVQALKYASSRSSPVDGDDDPSGVDLLIPRVVSNGELCRSTAGVGIGSVLTAALLLFLLVIFCDIIIKRSRIRQSKENGAEQQQVEGDEKPKDYSNETGGQKFILSH